MAIKASLRLALLLLFLHMIAAIIVYATAAPPAIRWVIILLIALSLIYYLARDVFLFLPDSWSEISLDQSGVSVVARDGSSFLARVTDTTVVSPCCIVLRGKLDGHRWLVSRVIFPDALSAGEFRELCVRLKFAKRERE
jgi:hypothetical protein